MPRLPSLSRAVVLFCLRPSSDERGGHICVVPRRQRQLTSPDQPLNRVDDRLQLVVWIAGHAAPALMRSMSARMSAALHAVVLGPSFTGFGYLPCLTPAHHAAREIGNTVSTVFS